MASNWHSRPLYGATKGRGVRPELLKADRALQNVLKQGAVSTSELYGKFFP